jgi:predicted RND superfamily exporter protein
MRDRIVAALERLLFARRWLVVLILAAVTAVMGLHASKLRVDAGFEKLLPLDHPYVKTFLRYGDEFGGANRLLVAVESREGDIFTADFFRRLKAVTDEVFFLPGVNRPSVRSLVTPNVRFYEIVEGGFTGGDVVPAQFTGTPKQLEQVRENVIKAGIVGRLVANDFRAAMISADFLERDPATGKRLDYIAVAHLLEKRIRKPFVDDRFDVHIIGFAKMIGDIADGAAGVVVFFGVAIAVTAVLVSFFTRSIRLMILPILCSTVAVVWDLGLLTFFGFGLDPLTILVPFLIFAIGVSHGVQIISAALDEMATGATTEQAARAAFRSLVVPGAVAVMTSAIGFFTILLIRIEMVQELALTAGLGVAVMTFTVILLLPVLLPYLHFDTSFRDRIIRAERSREPVWRAVSAITTPRGAAVTIGVALLALVVGLYLGSKTPVGELQEGVPELRPNARYNRDAGFITRHFSIGVDVISVIVETVPDACIQYDVMSEIDRFAWHMANVPGVQSVLSMPQVAKVINAGWNEGSLKWRVLPRDPQTMVQSVRPITENQTGLLNRDCSAMPVILFTEDHRAETIDRIVAAVNAYAAANDSPRHRFTLATGNVGVMAATNDEVERAQVPMMLWVYGAVLVFCLGSLRSVRGAICVLVPLILVSVLCNALMTLLQIGLKVSTLPVAALGVGLGDDYGIYLFSRMKEEFKSGANLREAYFGALRVTGTAVLVTGLTLALGVLTWVFSALQFQADMGLLLAFMLFFNMVGALLLLPAIARVLFPSGRGPKTASEPIREAV